MEPIERPTGSARLTRVDQDEPARPVGDARPGAAQSAAPSGRPRARRFRADRDAGSPAVGEDTPTLADLGRRLRVHAVLETPVGGDETWSDPTAPVAPVAPVLPMDTRRFQRDPLSCTEPGIVFVLAAIAM